RAAPQRAAGPAAQAGAVRSHRVRWAAEGAAHRAFRPPSVTLSKTFRSVGDRPGSQRAPLGHARLHEPELVGPDRARRRRGALRGARAVLAGDDRHRAGPAVRRLRPGRRGARRRPRGPGRLREPHPAGGGGGGRHPARHRRTALAGGHPRRAHRPHRRLGGGHRRRRDRRGGPAAQGDHRRVAVHPQRRALGLLRPAALVLADGRRGGRRADHRRLRGGLRRRADHPQPAAAQTRLRPHRLTRTRPALISAREGRTAPGVAAVSTAGGRHPPGPPHSVSTGPCGPGEGDAMAEGRPEDARPWSYRLTGRRLNIACAVLLAAALVIGEAVFATARGAAVQPHIIALLLAGSASVAVLDRFPFATSAVVGLTLPLYYVTGATDSWLPWLLLVGAVVLLASARNRAAADSTVLIA